jgi:hypothetical protein
MPKMTDDISAKIIEYRNRASVTRRSHYYASSAADKKNSLLGIPVVVITALVGTSIFGTLQTDPNVYIKIIAGLMSITAAVLAALQTYLGYNEKATKHKEAGAKYAAIWRCLDLLDTELRTRGDQFATSAIEELKKIVAKLDEIGKESPSVPDHAYNLAVNELRAKLAAQSTASGSPVREAEPMASTMAEPQTPQNAPRSANDAAYN